MSHREDLLIELGCEELPARLLKQQSALLAEGLGKRLEAAGLLESGGTPIILATPRRLAVRFSQVLARQADREQERKGPAEQVAFDDKGQPTRAAEGFARSVGKRVDELERIENEQGRWLYARVTEAGKSLAELLPGMLEQTVREMAGARSMRWSDRSERFLRPVRWLVVLHGSDVIELSAFGLQSDRVSRGHRIHAPGEQPMASAGEYEATLEKAHVLVDPVRRSERIAEQVRALGQSHGFDVELDANLVDENAGLTEWPVAVIGQFDPAFLEVPEEALISSMQQHQKCFALRAEGGQLSHHFVAVANIESRNPEAMIAGFERVIRPRLADARFFWDQDRKVSLDERRSRLSDILFQEKLGSIGDKAARLESLAVRLARSLGADPEATRIAARLCKCDLVTEMVGEFPELQGIMGRHYALAEGLDPAVAWAIQSHYQPRHAGDDLPEDGPGQALALADRLDTLVGIFAAGKKPKGSKDPFALRRAGLGVIRILLHTGLEPDMRSLIEWASESLSTQIAIQSELIDEVEHFLMERLRSHATEAGLATNTVHAVAAGKKGSVADFMARGHAIEAFSNDQGAESLIGANKRAQNLLRQAEEVKIGSVNDDLLTEEAEKRLFDNICQVEVELSKCLEKADYPQALALLATLKQPVDTFFDQVMVLCEDPALRANRLALLQRFTGLIDDIADIARLGR
jgi:glycyl-tRNA synthetase beta chain